MSASTSASTSTCVACHQPLILTVEDEEEEHGDSSEIVPDDVELRCGCHYHWSCALESLNVSYQSCPSCGATTFISTDPSSREKQIICTVRNEGGVEESYDFYPDLLQDAYLDEHPEARKAQAFLDLCASGDVDGILELLFDDGEEDVEGAPVDLLRYQSPLQKGRSPLHIAIMNQQQAVAWLILWLASGAPEYRFPADMLAAASQRGLARDDYNVSGKLDIRNLRDDEGLSAQDMARSVGGVWEVWDLPRDPHHRSREDVESVLTPI